MKLTLKNFQIHENTELELAPFTVIVGHSSSGKTAIMRAIKAVLFNSFIKQYVNNRTKEASVELSGDFGIIKATRKTSTSYEIDGQTYGAVGRDTLPQIVEKGFYPVETDKSVYYPQIASQWDSPFIISFSDSEISKLLSELSQTGRIRAAKSILQKKTSDTSSELRIRFKDKEELQKKLSNFDYLDPIFELFNQLKVCQDKVQHTQSVLDQINIAWESIKSIPVITVPQLDPAIGSEIDQLISFHKFLNSYESIVVPDFKVENPDNYLNLLQILDKSFDFEIQRLTIKTEALDTLDMVERSAARIGAIIEDSKAISEELVELEAELAGFDRCPTCNQLIS